MTAHSPRCSAPLPLSHAARASRGSVLARLMGLLALRRQRAQLARLDDAALRDIGLTREEARQEASRPVWDSPDFWRG
ncbi:DUF1127 domain-containing protein [Thalassobius sp. S69A]|uniref:DUF1127 domain-containing protein n=1 Tax=unclassified Thalassovita TaxID=2619711 RepID=UPI000C11A203|nr:hypothetical protein [Paracoccaceae bacterium]